MIVDAKTNERSVQFSCLPKFLVHVENDILIQLKLYGYNLEDIRSGFVPWG